MLTGILTGFALLVTLVAAGAAWLALRAEASAIAARDELQSGLRRLQGMRDELTAMTTRLDKLAGRVYAQSRRPPSPPREDHDANGFDTDLDPELAAELALQSAPAVSPGKPG